MAAMADEEPLDPPPYASRGTHTLRYIRSINSTPKSTRSDKTSPTLRATVMMGSGSYGRPAGHPTASSRSYTPLDTLGEGIHPVGRSPLLSTGWRAHRDGAKPG